MAIIKLHAGIQVGDFIRPYGHNVSLNQKWWKVGEISGDTLHCVDRRGYRRKFVWSPGRKWKVWQPGDSRCDGDVL